MFNPLSEVPQKVIDAAAQIKLLVLDVDGILTSGQISYTSNGAEIKNFNIKDGLGIKLLQKGGVEVAIITGRSSPMVERRAKELGIEKFIQSREDKWQALQEMTENSDISAYQIAYMGDDLPDLSAIKSVGLGATVADAHGEVIASAVYQTKACGGCGAVREMGDIILAAKQQYQAVTAHFR